MSEKKNGFLSNLQNDLPASLVVFLVALPLCLGIAHVSGAPLFSGLIAGIIGGIVVSLFSGSPLGVSGPAAGLAVIVLSAIKELEVFEVFLYAVVVAGVFQIILGVLRAGVIGYYFPSSVIKGMLSGIGLLIILKEIPHAVGYDKDPLGDFAWIQFDGQTTFSELGNMLNYINLGAVVIVLVSLAILILWEQPFMKKSPLFNIIQGPLIAVLAGIGLNILFRGSSVFALQNDQVVNLPVADSIAGFFGQFTFPDFSQWNNPRIYGIAAIFAGVASLETLLCVEAADKLDPQKRVTPTNRELFAQGIGNMVSGFIGGLPITQVIVRSSANIQSGGKTKASAFFHGILLLVSIIAIPHLLNLIPLSCLAAILFVVGYKLAKPSLFKEMYKSGIEQFIPFVVTIVAILLTNLLVGIVIGLAIAVIYILWNNYRTPYLFNPKDYVEGKPVEIELSEDVSFLNKACILRTLNQMPKDADVVIDATRTRSIHPDALEIIEDFKHTAKDRNITLTMKGFAGAARENPVEEFGRTVLKMKKTNGRTKRRSSETIRSNESSTNS